LLDQEVGKGNRSARSISRSASSNNRVASSRQSSTSIGGKINSLGRQGESAAGLQIREDPKTGIFVEGLTQVHVKSKDQLL